MTRYELPGYTLVAVDNQQLRRDLAKLPRLKSALEESTGIKVKATGIPTVVYVVPDSIWDKYLEPAPVLQSEFIPTRFTNYIIANNAASIASASSTNTRISFSITRCPVCIRCGSTRAWP